MTLRYRCNALSTHHLYRKPSDTKLKKKIQQYQKKKKNHQNTERKTNRKEKTNKQTNKTNDKIIIKKKKTPLPYIHH